jgi:hypothetical protein
VYINSRLKVAFIETGTYEEFTIGGRFVTTKLNELTAIKIESEIETSIL